MRPGFLVAAACILAVGPAAGGPQVKSPVKASMTPAERDFCTLVWGCGLPLPQGYCPEQSTVEKSKLVYDSTRCLEARTLTSRGVGPEHPLVGFRLYRFLGMEYRVIYTVEDDIPISEPRLAYLLADLPLSAHLISHYQKEPYTAEYVDAEHQFFKGTKGKRLKGEARLISGSAAERRLFYFGQGVAEVAWWRLRGPALMDFSYAPGVAPGFTSAAAKGKGLHYRMKILVFPGNGVINGIMNLGLFRKVVLGKIRDVLVDITETARKLAADGGKSIRDSKDWSAEEKRKIEEFLKLP